MYQLIINYKTYKESLGENSKKISKAILELKKLADKKNVRIIACPQILDLRETSKIGICVFSQHMDNYSQGAHTGYLLPESLIDAGIKGTLINHSEHRINFELIKEEIKKSKELGLEICVCAKDEKEVKKLSKLNPDFIAVEPPELIGGDISISTAKPELITKSVKSANNVNLLIGAGVKNSKDVEIGIKLGSKGILVASGVVKSQNIKESIKELLDGF